MIQTDEISTAKIVCQAFPRPTMFPIKPNGNITITELNAALFRARRYSKYDTLGGCIAWAQKIMNDSKPTIKKRIVARLDARIDEILREQEAGSNANGEENK